MSDDPIGDALRADAEDARGEIRDAGLVCPSCDRNAAGLFGRHCLIMITRTPVSGDRGFGHPVALIGEPEYSCECRDGQRVILTGAGFETWKAAANIALMDDFWFRDTIAFARDFLGTGPGPGNLTGLLSFLGGPG
jgi:hypothetical protein